MHNKYGRAHFLSRASSASSAAAAAAADTTQLVSDDIINMIATFGSCHDLCVLGQVCRRFSPLPFNDDLWELRALDTLPSVKQVRSAMAKLKLNSCRQLVEAFTRIGIPGGILGFWQSAATPSSNPEMNFSDGGGGSPREDDAAGLSVRELEARGELLRITVEEGGFLCESLAPNGARRRIFTILVSKNRNGMVKIGYFSLEKESSIPFGGVDSWVPGDSMAEAKARYTFAVPGSTERAPIRASGPRAFLLGRMDGRTSRYVKLTAPACQECIALTRRPEAASVVDDDDDIDAQGLCGLWCAPYGNHGLEIIQLSTDSSCSPSEGAETVNALAAAAMNAAAAAGSPSLLQSSWSRRGGGGEGECGGSCSGASTGRMTDGSESVCTSAPATDGTGSEAGYCSREGDRWDRSSDMVGDSEYDSDGYGVSERGLHDVHSTPNPSARKKIGAEKISGTGAGVTAATASCSNCDPDLPSQLFGFKVTGDDNVPAGKTSFIIDLKTKFDVDEELQLDTRPVVMFLASGAVMANLASRREHISSWCKGGGQINRVPGRWSPEWVDVEFIRYRDDYRCAFSVIFRQPTQAVRVVMDFDRAPGCKKWPRWCAVGTGNHGCGGGARMEATPQRPSLRRGA